MKKVFAALLGLCLLIGLFPAQAAGASLTVDLYSETAHTYSSRRAQRVAVFLDGQALDGPVPSLLLEGTTLVPVRALAEALGAEVQWDAAGRQATFQRGGTTVTLPLGSGIALVNGQRHTLSGPGAVGVRFRGSSCTMAPLRFVAQALGANVGWDSGSSTAYLTTSASSATVPIDPWRYTIAIDPGHGGYATGAVYQGVLEKDINLSVALLLRDRLLSLGYNVILTLDTDRFLGLYERCDIANAAGADLFISLHSNAAESNPSFRGLYTYYYPGSSRGLALAQTIQTPVCQETGAIDRGVLSENFVVVRETRMPAVLVEMGFMSCPEELRALTDPTYQQKLARGIAEGAVRYLNAG